MWKRVATAALAVQAALLTVMQLPLTTLKDGIHISGLARTGCSSHLTWYLSPNVSAALLPICSLADPQRLLQRFERENIFTSGVVLEAEEDSIPETTEELARPIWLTMYGSMAAVTGLQAAPLLLVLSQVPRTLVDFLVRSTVLLFIATLASNYLCLGSDVSLEVMRLSSTAPISTAALIVMGSVSGLQMVAGVLFPLCLLAWPAGLSMAVVGVKLAKEPFAPALVAAAIVAWFTFVGFYVRSDGRKFERRSEPRGRSSQEPSKVTKRSRSATPPPALARAGEIMSARAGGA
mmetsp:Transcript_143737/g.250531  ORF Transcript_143737/g.250531 Transcript_143737/m.250531 type:complete len:292 (+) Transcript_143737:65-940(+)